MAQAERIAKFEETTRVAFDIIDKQAASREAKTQRLREARLAALSAGEDPGSESL